MAPAADGPPRWSRAARPPKLRAVPGQPQRIAIAAAALLVALAPAAARAQGQALAPKLLGRPLAEALARGGHVILLRHTRTDAFVPEDSSDLADCSTQRNLSDVGRRQAKRLGEAFRALGIRVDRVLSSPYCRCVETGELAFGSVETREVLSTGDDLEPDEKDERGAQVRALLGTAPAEGTNTVLITHSGNLLYSFGLRVKPEGIAHVFRPSVVGPAVYVGYMLPDEWPALAGLPPGKP